MEQTIQRLAQKPVAVSALFFEVIDDRNDAENISMAPDMFSIGGGDDEAPFIEGPDLPEPLEAPPEDSIDGGCRF